MSFGWLARLPQSRRGIRGADLGQGHRNRQGFGWHYLPITPPLEQASPHTELPAAERIRDRRIGYLPLVGLQLGRRTTRPRPASSSRT